MRAKGIAYDTGFVRNGEISRQSFDPDVVKRELTIIRDDLHCNAVQVVGGDPERLELTAGRAAELGLEVWFSPYPIDLTTAEILSLFADCAQRAERLRKAGAEIVFVTGVELSIMNQGFRRGGRPIPGRCANPCGAGKAGRDHWFRYRHLAWLERRGAAQHGDFRVRRDRPPGSVERPLRPRRARPGHLPARAAGDLRRRRR